MQPVRYGLLLWDGKGGTELNILVLSQGRKVVDSLVTCSGTLGQPTNGTLAQCRCVHIATGVGLKSPCPVPLSTFRFCHPEGQLMCQNGARAHSGVANQE